MSDWRDFKKAYFLPGPKKRKLYVALISILLVMNPGLPTLTYTLHIKETIEGTKLATISVSPGEVLKVEYVHSIYKVKQSEVFSIGRDLRFYLEKVMFGSYTAAAYYDSTPPQDFGFKDGLWMLKRGRENYSILKYRVNPDTSHVLTLKNLTLDLSSNSKTPGGRIEISLEGEAGN